MWPFPVSRLDNDSSIRDVGRVDVHVVKAQLRQTQLDGSLGVLGQLERSREARVRVDEALGSGTAESMVSWRRSCAEMFSV